MTEIEKAEDLWLNLITIDQQHPSKTLYLKKIQYKKKLVCLINYSKKAYKLPVHTKKTKKAPFQKQQQQL